MGVGGDEAWEEAAERESAGEDGVIRIYAK
jgi:hypothetical protein